MKERTIHKKNQLDQKLWKEKSKAVNDFLDTPMNTPLLPPVMHHISPDSSIQPHAMQHVYFWNKKNAKDCPNAKQENMENVWRIY